MCGHALVRAGAILGSAVMLLRLDAVLSVPSEGQTGEDVG